MIKDTKLTLPPCLSSQGEELRWRAPRVEGSLDNRVIDVAPLSITHRVGDVRSPTLVYSEYTPVGIMPISWVCWEYHSPFVKGVERVLGDVKSKLIMMQVFYHMTLEGHYWEIQWAIGWVEMCSLM